MWTFCGRFVSVLWTFSRKRRPKFLAFSKPQKPQSPALRGFEIWCGTRRTVCFGEARFFGCLEFVGKFGVPQLVTINKSASYGVQWNRTRLFLKCRMLLAYKAIIQNCLWNSKPPDTERCRSLLPLRMDRIAQKKTLGVVTENR